MTVSETPLQAIPTIVTKYVLDAFSNKRGRPTVSVLKAVHFIPSVRWYRTLPSLVGGQRQFLGGRVPAPAGRVQQLAGGFADGAARQRSGCPADVRGSTASRHHMRHAEGFHPADARHAG